MIKRIALAVCLVFLCNSLSISAQDSTTVEDLKEEKELKFQQYFFKALSEKSIKNYEKAIQSLEICNETLPGEISVLFEFSKNYLLLNKLYDAKLYIRKALEKEPQNIWMLSHLVTIYERERDYQLAVEAQRKLVQLNPKENIHLARLLYQSGDYEASLSIMKELENKGQLSRYLKTLMKNLESRKSNKVKKESSDLQSMICAFEEGDLSFSLLKQILDKAIKEGVSIFHQYSVKAMDLFPAQPYVYLMQGKSLQMQEKFQQAISTLENGIDFVIDNPNLEAEFCDNLANAYDRISNANKALEYRNKAKKLKALK